MTDTSRCAKGKRSTNGKAIAIPPDPSRRKLPDPAEHQHLCEVLARFCRRYFTPKQLREYPYTAVTRYDDARCGLVDKVIFSDCVRDGGPWGLFEEDDGDEAESLERAQGYSKDVKLGTETLSEFVMDEEWLEQMRFMYRDATADEAEPETFGQWLGSWIENLPNDVGQRLPHDRPIRKVRIRIIAETLAETVENEPTPTPATGTAA